MELDDLKDHWKQADKIEILQQSNTMEIIQHKNTGPLAALKRGFKIRIIAMTAVTIFILATNLQHLDKTLSSVLFWFYILFCISVIIFARLNYGRVKKMQQMDAGVKSNLEQQIFILEKGVRQNLMGIRMALVLFIILIEVLPYFQHFRMLNTWHSLSPYTRYGAYTALFLFQFFVTRILTRRKFVKHIDHLKEFVKEMQ